MRDCYSAFAHVFASTRGFVAASACASSIINMVAEVCGFVLAIARTWSRHCICMQVHAGDIAAACTGVPTRLPTFIPTKIQPKKMEFIVFSTYNRMIKFRIKLCLLAREYVNIATAHKECG